MSFIIVFCTLVIDRLILHWCLSLVDTLDTIDSLSIAAVSDLPSASLSDALGACNSLRVMFFHRYYQESTYGRSSFNCCSMHVAVSPLIYLQDTIVEHVHCNISQVVVYDTYFIRRILSTSLPDRLGNLIQLLPVMACRVSVM
jgi:hypothetical protein